MKYDIQSLNDKVDNIEHHFLKHDGLQFDGQLSLNTSENNFQNELSNLPLQTEKELDAFEKNLLNNDFRTKLVIFRSYLCVILILNNYYR